MVIQRAWRGNWAFGFSLLKYDNLLNLEQASFSET